MSRVDHIFLLKQIVEKAHEKKHRVYECFMDWKAYDKVKREALCQVLRMHDVDGKLLNEIMIVNSLACLRVKGVGASVSESKVM